VGLARDGPNKRMRTTATGLGASLLWLWASCCRTKKLSSSQPTDSPYRRTLSRVCSNAWFCLPGPDSLQQSHLVSRSDSSRGNAAKPSGQMAPKAIDARHLTHTGSTGRNLHHHHRRHAQGRSRIAATGLTNTIPSHELATTPVRTSRLREKRHEWNPAGTARGTPEALKQH
jgi:hypothetical protein